MRREEENRERVGADCGHYGSPAEGGILPAETALHWAGAECPGRSRPPAPAPGCWAPPSGSCAAAPRDPAGTRVQRLPLLRRRGVPVVRGGRAGVGVGCVGGTKLSGCPFPKRSPAASSFGACGSPSSPAEPLRALRWPGSRPNRSLRRSPPSSPSARVLPQQLGGRERPPAAAGRRLGAASRARGAAIWSLGSGRGCGSKGRGLAARPEA